MINKYNTFLEKQDMDEDWENDLNDDYYDDDYYGHSVESRYDDDEEEEEDDSDSDLDNADMEHLLYLLRSMFKNKGLEDVEITNKGLDILVTCETPKVEKFSDIISIFDIMNKLHTDILPEYDSEFDMYQTRKGQNYLEFKFYYNEDWQEDEEDEEDEDENRMPF